MIIYGTGGRRIAQHTIKPVCTACEAQNSLQMHIYQRYGHVFWIPFVPSGKTAATQCNRCHAVLQQAYFPDTYMTEYLRLKKESKTPWWAYAGLGLLVIAIASAIIIDRQDDAYDAQIILTPQKNDLYQVKISASEYTLYKVDKVDGNMVYLFENEFAINQSSGIDDLKEKPFTKESYPVSKYSLKVMLEKGEIIDVERD
ncbi:MAG: hypothetical protein V4581_15690 [Bacteroidota bacterium]